VPSPRAARFSADRAAASSYAPAFARHGIDPGRVIVVESAEEKNRWWSAEQVLRANSAGAMLFWPRAVNDAQTRRLQLAAQESQSLAYDLPWSCYSA
jgi:hypothetical protein